MKRVGAKPMTKARTAFQAFQEQLAVENNRPLWALAKGLFWGFITFNLLMGFLLGTVPLARNAYFHFIYHIQLPVLTWFDEMGWEGQVTSVAFSVAGLLAVLYITRNYLALILRAGWMKAVDLKNWFDKNVVKKIGAGPNVKPLVPRPRPRPPEPVVEEPKARSQYQPPPTRDTSQDTAIVGG